MADLGAMVGQVAQGAASGPLGAIGGILQGVKGIIGEFVTDPNAKLAATQKMLELQSQLQLAALDAQTKQTIAADDAAKNDHYLWGARATFCYGFTALYLLVYSGLAAKVLGQQPPTIPMNLNVIFAGVMLGCIGIPAGMETIKSIMGMPGESSVSVLGMKVGNKS